MRKLDVKEIPNDCDVNRGRGRKRGVMSQEKIQNEKTANRKPRI
jgi:hypothetical protein